MKKTRTARRILALSASLLIAAFALTTSGCGKADLAAEPDDTSDGSQGIVTQSFTATPGAYVRYQVTGAGKITFNVTGIDMDLESDKQPIVYFYDNKGYGSGRTTGGFQGELRNYKLKFYDTNGNIASESYHGYSFRSSETYQVTLEWATGSNGFVASTVNGQEFRKYASVADTFTLGIGWPPSGDGWNGAVWTNVVWPTGATQVQ